MFSVTPTSFCRKFGLTIAVPPVLRVKSFQSTSTMTRMPPRFSWWNLQLPMEGLRGGVVSTSTIQILENTNYKHFRTSKSINVYKLPILISLPFHVIVCRSQEPSSMASSQFPSKLAPPQFQWCTSFGTAPRPVETLA